MANYLFQWKKKKKIHHDFKWNWRHQWYSSLYSSKYNHLQEYVILNVNSHDLLLPKLRQFFAQKRFYLFIYLFWGRFPPATPPSHPSLFAKPLNNLGLNHVVRARSKSPGWSLIKLKHIVEKNFQKLSVKCKSGISHC